MEKSTKIIQIYGYTICLVAVITFIIAAVSLFNAVIDRSEPLHAGWSQPGTPSLASFENYKMDILTANAKNGDKQSSNFVPDDKTLRLMYEAAKNDKIQKNLHNSNKDLLVSSIMIIIAISIFLTHWLWMKKKVNS